MQNDGDFVDVILLCLTENTVHGHYDDLLVNAVRENRVYCESRAKPTITLCGKVQIFIML